MSDVSHRTIILFFLACLFVFIAPAAQSMTKIGIIYRDDIKLHHQLAEDLKSSFADKENYSAVPWHLKEQWTDEDRKHFNDEQFTQLVAIGDLALSFCLESSNDIDGIFLLVSNNTLSTRAESTGWQGMRIWAPMAEQFARTRAILPRSRSLGILVSPTCQADKNILQETARQFGYTLNFTTVENRRQILPSLANIFQQNDAIFMLPDPGLMNTVVLLEMLRLQKQHRVPLIAVSKRFVTFGAFMSVDYSLEEIIREITQRITHSSSSADKPLAECCLVVHVNKKAAKQLRIPVPDDSNIAVQYTSEKMGGGQ